ncbi:general substrate transporter [Protomyces lactucae-debilis]|uniref:General substrate transporter n=1 Tax=Protomyces lactucae-debilis TaxID=2754530 RepID=A0A1Y2F0N2_PROLT|nr:general substrate transporter [Protomyces lactucae-debilis]ORY77054.1 general substrate transporter [Protomyces lactucae-debilis]
MADVKPGPFQRSLGASAIGTPPQIFNSVLFLGTTIFGILGAARGFDEGNISGMLASPAFQALFGLKKDATHTAQQVADVKGNISGMVQICSIGGALIAFTITDRIGRVWALRQLCVLWIGGVLLQIFAQNIGMLYAGRALAGLGIGQTTVVGPTYLVEVAPRQIRGLCSGIFSGSVYLGIMLAYFANYGSALHQVGRIRWQIPISLQAAFAGMALVLSIFAIESPRFLIMKGKHEQAAKNLSKLRGLPIEHEYMQSELVTVTDALEKERAIMSGRTLTGRIFEIVGTHSNRFRLFGIGIMIQLLGQWSGANSITVYAPEYFSLLGIHGTETGLLATAVFGVVKLLSSLSCAFFLIDRIGRKRSLYIGVGLQAISMLYIAAFLTAAPEISSPEVTNHSAAVRHASVFGIMMIYVNGFGWAMGYNSIQYLINSEIFPLHLRSLSASIIMAVHFANQYGNSKSVPTMLLPRSEGGIGPAGTMWFFVVICALGLIYIFFFLPETGGYTLEEMEDIFNFPWWQIGRRSISLRRSGDSRRSSGGEESVDCEKSGGQHIETKSTCSNDAYVTK